MQLHGKPVQVLLIALLMLWPWLPNSSAQPAVKCPRGCSCSMVQGDHVTSCSSLMLASIPGEIPVNTNILLLDYNSLSSLPSGVIDNLPYITALLLNNNQITTIAPGIFDNMPELEDLYLSHNQIASLPAGLFDKVPKLVILKIDKNQLTSLPSGIFDHLPLAEWIDLNSNQLTVHAPGLFDHNSELQELSLQKNDVTALPMGFFDNMPKLLHLDISDNRLTALPSGIFDKLVNLESLYISENHISSIPAGLFDKLFELQQLVLNDNRLTSVPVLGNPDRLQLLFFHGNNIISIPPGAFDAMPTLQRLSLDSNNLTTLPSGIFHNLPQLSNLHLYDNPWYEGYHFCAIHPVAGILRNWNDTIEPVLKPKNYLYYKGIEGLCTHLISNFVHTNPGCSRAIQCRGTLEMHTCNIPQQLPPPPPANGVCLNTATCVPAQLYNLFVELITRQPTACACLPGFTPTSVVPATTTSYVCNDVDECQATGMCLCPASSTRECNNTVGSYTCSCKAVPTATSISQLTRGTGTASGQGGQGSTAKPAESSTTEVAIIIVFCTLGTVLVLCVTAYLLARSWSVLKTTAQPQQSNTNNEASLASMENQVYGADMDDKQKMVS